MPLITITCDPNYYPAGTPASGSLPSHKAMDLIEFARKLPRLFIDKAKILRLDSETPEAAVQVDFQCFNPYSINTPNVWFRVEFTEQVDDENERVAIAETLVGIIAPKLRDHGLIMVWALDVFWGPGHGCYTDGTGKVIQDW